VGVPPFFTFGVRLDNHCSGLESRLIDFAEYVVVTVPLGYYFAFPDFRYMHTSISGLANLTPKAPSSGGFR
jgi:hypothetical protein